MTTEKTQYQKDLEDLKRDANKFLNDRIELLKKGLEEPLKEFEKGVWYKSRNGSFCALFSEDGYENKGFINNEWTEGIPMTDPLAWRKADLSVVEELLIKEFNKKYKVGDTLLSAYNKISTLKIDNSYKLIINEKMSLTVTTDTSLGITVFLNGQWAEILPERVEIEDNAIHHSKNKVDVIFKNVTNPSKFLADLNKFLETY